MSAMKDWMKMAVCVGLALQLFAIIYVLIEIHTVLCDILSRM